MYPCALDAGNPGKQDGAGESRITESFRRLARVVLPIASLLLATACDWPWQGEADDGLIHLSGTVEADEVDLGFQVAGRIADLKVDEGEQVAVGELVASLEPQDYEIALDRAEAEAKAAAAALAALEAGTRIQELRVAEATVEQAKSRTEFARSEIKRVAGLVPKKLASQQQLDQGHLQLDVAVADLAQAEQRLQLLREGPRREDIDKAAAELAARRQAVELARLQLAYATLKSPVAGTVSVRLAQQGEVVAVGRPVFRIAQLATPWVRAYLNETDLARVKLGQKALARVDGLPNRVFEGRLTFISPVAEFTPKTVETRELRVDLVYRVKVAVDNPEGLLKIGMPADVVLETTP